MKSKILVHIPHSSLKIPTFFWENCILSKREIKNENYFLCDIKVNKFIPFNFNKVCFHFSRIFCDVERFLDNEKEVMFKKGMGFIYTKTSYNKTFINHNEDYKNRIMKNYYNVHHNKLNKKVKNILNKNDICYLIDLHSFSDEIALKLLNKSNCPDICIGVDDNYLDKKLLNFTISFFKSFNYKIKINYPYEGTIIPSNYFNSQAIKSLMIEINKNIYINDFKKFKKIMKIYFKQINKL